MSKLPCQSEHPTMTGYQGDQKSTTTGSQGEQSNSDHNEDKILNTRSSPVQCNGSFSLNNTERFKKGKNCNGQTLRSVISNKLVSDTGYHIFKLASVPTTTYGSEIWGVYHSTTMKKRFVRDNGHRTPLEGKVYEVQHRK